MSRRLFKWIISLVLILVLTSMAMVTLMTEANYSDQYSKQLLEEGKTLAQSLEYSGYGLLGTYTTPHRVTLIAADGEVLYDNHIELAALASHGDREEFLLAQAEGTAIIERYSASLEQKSVYAAVRLRNGDVLRLADDQYTPIDLLEQISRPVLLVILLATLITILMASFLSRMLLHPVNSIDLEHPEESAVYPELRPLVQRLRLQNLQIRQQMEALEEEHERQDRMRREFTANVSHELKTPLTSISGFAEIIRDGFVRTEDIPRFAGNIYKEAQRLIMLVGDILKLSRLDEHGITYDRTPLDLHAVCERTAASLQIAAAQRAITVTVEGEPAYISGYASIIDEMVYNLCDNAIKYNREQGSVILRTTHAEGSARLEVIDTGIGIPQADQSRVFERFYRVNKSHSKEIGGTGLGLSIVKHAAILHNAQVTLESALNAGTTITITFPYHAAELKKEA